MLRTSIPVFCYHNVSDVDGHSPDRFADHLDAILDAGYRTISSLDLLKVVRGEMKAPRKSVVLTFDDGHISNWLDVVPMLEQRGMTGTFFTLPHFTVPGDVRTESNYTRMPDAFRAAHMDGDCSQFCNESELRAMLDKGMEVFSHGCRHEGIFRTLRPYAAMGQPHAHWGAWSIYPEFNEQYPTFDVASGYVYDGFQPRFDTGDAPRFVTRTPQERLEFCRRDFRESYEWFREFNGCDDQLFCWPWGQFCDDAEAELKKAGYAGAFTLERWANAKGTDPFRLNRLGVGKSKSGKWVQTRLRMYGSDPTARVFFKLHRKRDEVKSVLYATDSDKLSGGSRQMINNIKAMADMGLTVHAVLRPGSPIIDALKETDVTVTTFDRFSDYLQAGKHFRRLVTDHGIDVIHTFHNRAYKAGVIAKLMGANCKVFINRGVISRPNDIFFLWTALADGVITNSRLCADVLRKHRVMKKRLSVVYNAYSGPDFGTPKPRKKRGVRIAYVGNGAEIKGFDVFLQAAARFCESGAVRDVEFVGIGVKEAELPLFEAHLSPTVRGRLRVTEHIPHAEVLEELRHSDMLVMSSRKESLPNAILEGFDLGLPALCTRVGGVPEIVADGVSGFICESEDSDCLASRMRTLADDPALRHNMGLVGRAMVRSLLMQEFKGRNLMRVYMGETLVEELDIQAVAETVDRRDDPFEACDDHTG